MKVRTCSASSWPGLWTRGKDTVGSRGGGCGHGLRVGVRESGFRARCLCLTLEVRLCKQLTFGEAARSKYRNCTIFETSL